MIYGKSNHPVEIKKIDLETWEFRDELEHLIKIRLEQIQRLGNGKINIQKIREYYKGNWNSQAESAPSLEANSELDTSGNPMDEDAKAMAEAMSGSGQEEDSADSTEEGISENTEENTNELQAEGVEVTSNEVSASSEQSDADQIEVAQPEMDQAAIDAMMDGSSDGVENITANEATNENTSENTNLGESISTEPKEVFKEDMLIPGTFRQKPDLVENKMGKGKLVLADIDIESMLFFSNKQYLGGKSIVIRFLLPKPFIVSAQVISSKRFNLRTRIISENRLDYRTYVRFTHLTKGERTLLRQFLASIQPDIPSDQPRKKAVEADGDGDLEDFDDLGL